MAQAFVMTTLEPWVGDRRALWVVLAATLARPPSNILNDAALRFGAAYLDRRHPRWREDAQGDAATGSGAARSGKMTKEEAYQILSGPGEEGIGHGCTPSAQSCTQECCAVVKDLFARALARMPPGG
jgi:hypothetical protein